MTMSPPWRPHLARADDTSYFDEFEGEDASISNHEELEETLPEDEKLWGKLQHAFKSRGNRQHAQRLNSGDLSNASTVSFGALPRSTPPRDRISQSSSMDDADG